MHSMIRERRIIQPAENRAGLRFTASLRGRCISKRDCGAYACACVCAWGNGKT
jgi:hypothetical protein